MDPYGRGFYPPGPPAGYPPYPGAPGMPPGFPPGQPFPPPGAPPMHPPPGFQPPPGMPPYMRPPPQGIPPFPPGAPMIPPPHLPPNMQPHPLARGPMPPLPPGPMGGIPPVMPTNPHPLPVLPGRGAPIPLHANTMQPQPPSDRSISTPSPLAFPFLLDKKTTVYVGKISPKADNELMQQLLEVCGRVDSWRRLKDPATNQWSTFGFCDFHSAEGALRALKLLNGFQVEGEPLLVKVDEKTSKFLEEYKTKKEELAKKNTGTPAKEEPKSEAEAPAQAESESKPTDEGAAKAPTPAEKKDDQELEEARTALKQVIETHEERKRQAAQMKEEAMKATMDRLLASAQATPTDLELPEDKKKAEQIIESIRKFREMEAQRERERREREKDRERDQSRLRRRERERERERQKEEERERRRREREAERAGRRDRDSHRSPDDSERSRRPHRDDRSQTPQREPAPSPSSAPETPNEQQQQSETTAAAVAASPSQQQQQQQQTPKPFTVAPTKLKLATSTPAGPRVQQPLFSDEETTDAPWTVKQKRPLVRLDNDSETKKARMDEKNARAADEAEMQKQQQQKPIDPKTIIQNIPTEKEELFAFPINWEAVDKHKLHEKLRGWIEKKIKEYLGEEEADMVDFIVSKLSLHSPASEVLEDLSPVLDVDAETFVKSLWRMLIFETMTATE